MVELCRHVLTCMRQVLYSIYNLYNIFSLRLGFLKKKIFTKKKKKVRDMVGLLSFDGLRCNIRPGRFSIQLRPNTDIYKISSSRSRSISHFTYRSIVSDIKACSLLWFNLVTHSFYFIKNINAISLSFQKILNRNYVQYCSGKTNILKSVFSKSTSELVSRFFEI